MKKIIYSILIIIVMVTIFMFSNQPADDSTKLSNGFIEKTIGNVYKLFDNNVTEEELDKIKENYATPIRKLAHVTIYFILGILVYLLLCEFNIETGKTIILAFIICMSYSISDEIHQIFVPGRSGQVTDVILDSCSSFIGMMLIKRVSRKYKNI